MYPADYHYTKSHQWIHVQDSVGTVGTTDYAQEQLGDVVFVELPKVGTLLQVAQTYGSIESVKAVIDLDSPASGEVIEINGALANSPENVNKDAHGTAWLLKLRLSDPKEITALMDAKAYESYTSQIAT